MKRTVLVLLSLMLLASVAWAEAHEHTYKKSYIAGGIGFAQQFMFDPHVSNLSSIGLHLAPEANLSLPNGLGLRASCGYSYDEAAARYKRNILDPVYTPVNMTFSTVNLTFGPSYTHIFHWESFGDEAVTIAPLLGGSFQTLSIGSSNHDDNTVAFGFGFSGRTHLARGVELYVGFDFLYANHLETPFLYLNYRIGVAYPF